MTHSNITRRSTIAGIAAGVGLASATVSGDFIRSARAQSARKTFVLVHGTFCGAGRGAGFRTIWRRMVIRFLRRRSPGWASARIS
jgi:hypothetical protein